MSSSTTTRVLVSAGIASVVLSGALVGAAMASEDAPTFSACEKHGRVIPRTIRVDDEPQCRWGRTLVSWNAVGATGPQGPQGEQGPAGAGFADVVLRERSETVTVTPIDVAGPTSIAAVCEVDEVVVGGGLTSFGGGVAEPDLRHVSSGPFFDGSRSGWTVNWVTVGEPVTLQATVAAICVPGQITQGSG